MLDLIMPPPPNKFPVGSHVYDIKTILFVAKQKRINHIGWTAYTRVLCFMDTSLAFSPKRAFYLYSVYYVYSFR
jgi:hypothetical protein